MKTGDFIKFSKNGCSWLVGAVREYGYQVTSVNGTERVITVRHKSWGKQVAAEPFSKITRPSSRRKNKLSGWEVKWAQVNIETNKEVTQ